MTPPNRTLTKVPKPKVPPKNMPMMRIVPSMRGLTIATLTPDNLTKPTIRPSRGPAPSPQLK